MNTIQKFFTAIISSSIKNGASFFTAGITLIILLSTSLYLKNLIIKHDAASSSGNTINQGKWLRDTIGKEVGSSFKLSRFQDALIQLEISYGSDDSAFDIALFKKDGGPIWHSNEKLQGEIEKLSAKGAKPAKHLSSLMERFETQVSFTGVGKNRPYVKLPTGYLVFLDFSNEDVYLLWEKRGDGLNTRKIGVLLFIISLVGAAIIAFLVRRLMDAVTYPIESVKNSMKAFLEEQDLQSVEYYKNNEFGDLVANYNELISYIDKNDLYNNTSTGSAVDRQHEAEVLQQGQNELFHKPLHRLQSAEVAMYPKKPTIEQRDFLTAIEFEGGPLVSLIHFDIVNEESTQAKHDLRNALFEMSDGGTPFSNISQALWEALFEHIDFGPGFLCMRLGADKALHIIKNCDADILSVSSDGVIESVRAGSGVFQSEFPGVEEVALGDNSAFVVILTRELTAGLGAPAAQFLSSEISPDLLRERLGGSGKEVLYLVLEKIAAQIGDPKVLPGLAAVVRLK